MKRFLKRMMALCAALALVITACACGGTNGDTGTAKVKIGILQYASHSSLDNCYKGVLQALNEAGYVDGETAEIDFKNAQGSEENSNLMAKNMVAGKYDMIIAIATPAAMAAYSAAKEDNIPVVFTAVSDPVGAGIVESMEQSNTCATGTADGINIDGQLKMIRAMLPDAKTVGVLYTTSEPNSITQLNQLKEASGAYGLEIVEVGITGPTEVAAGAATLVARGVDCVTNLTDNNVVDNISTLLHATDEANIPVFGSEEMQVLAGCVASETLDYVALGDVTGKMAVQILKGEAQPNTLAPQRIVESEPVYSAKNCAKFGIALPEAYVDARNMDEAE